MHDVGENPDFASTISPANGALARYDVALAVIETEILLYVTDALAWQAVHAEVARVTHTLRLA